MTSPTPPPPVRRRLRGADRRQRIVDAAVEVFAAQGYAGCSTSDLANAAGVSRTVLYDHFADKRELYLHVLATQSDLMLAEVAGGISGEGAPRDRMRATVTSYLAFTRDHPATRRLLIDPIPAGDPELDAVVLAHLQERQDAVTLLLSDDLARAGVDLSSSAAAVMVAVVSGATDGVARWWALHPEVPLDEVADAAVRLLWHGMPNAGAD